MTSSSVTYQYEPLGADSHQEAIEIAVKRFNNGYSAPSLDESNLELYGNAFAEQCGLNDVAGMDAVEWDDDDDEEDTEAQEGEQEEEGLVELSG